MAGVTNSTTAKAPNADAKQSLTSNTCRSSGNQMHEQKQASALLVEYISTQKSRILNTFNSMASAVAPMSFACTARNTLTVVSKILSSGQDTEANLATVHDKSAKW